MNTESDTPKTDALMPDQVHKRTIYDHIQVMETHARKLETELADMRTIFVSYILSEEAWRESKKDPIPMLIEANFMREKAKEVLGL